ncbi:hypothetical protein ACFO3J_24945 [Streptomyces polygonati]|uniref:Uncharacterized protein n=1 Tax=Streptomyces polygonati TaxID=1617087 RepID=A0ABV8HUV8_9ACTN
MLESLRGLSPAEASGVAVSLTGGLNAALILPHTMGALKDKVLRFMRS